MEDKHSLSASSFCPCLSASPSLTSCLCTYFVFPAWIYYLLFSLFVFFFIAWFILSLCQCFPSFFLLHSLFSESPCCKSVSCCCIYLGCISFTPFHISPRLNFYFLLYTLIPFSLTLITSRVSVKQSNTANVRNPPPPPCLLAFSLL